VPIYYSDIFGKGGYVQMKALLALIMGNAPEAPHDDRLRAGQFEANPRISVWLAMLPYR
jgi:hypothetical protein